MEVKLIDKLRRALGDKKYTREDLDKKYYPLLDAVLDSCELADCFGKRKKKQLYPAIGEYSGKNSTTGEIEYNPAYNDYYFYQYFYISPSDQRNSLFQEKLDFLDSNLSKYKIRKIGTAQRLRNGQAEIYLSCSSFAKKESFSNSLADFFRYCKYVKKVNLHGIENYEDLVDELIGYNKEKQPRHTTSPQPEVTLDLNVGNNKLHFSHTILKTLGRKKQEDVLKEFLNCGQRVTWLQLAGEAGQGKSRLAFDLACEAKSTMGWNAGFVTDDDMEFFREHIKTWQPEKPTLLIFDYVVGRTNDVQLILRKLSERNEHITENIRILLLERQPWNEGGKPNQTNENDESGLSVSPSVYSDRAEWYLKLCDQYRSKGNDTVIDDIRFTANNCKGVEVLKTLDVSSLTEIVKQVASLEQKFKSNKHHRLSISSEEIEEILQRIDKSGRPLYAYLLGIQLANNQAGYQQWTYIDLLTKTIEREIDRRWKASFKRTIPAYRDDDLSIKIAVLATIVKELDYDHELIESSFGKITSTTIKEASTITSGKLIEENAGLPESIMALEPDLLGEWFVLHSFDQGVEFQTLLDIAWQIEPSNTAAFLQRITQDFITLPKKQSGKQELTQQLLAHPFPNDSRCIDALSTVAEFVSDRFRTKNLSIPPSIIKALTYAAEQKNVVSALTALGLIYFEGRGVAKDTKRAIAYYEQAADAGNSRALSNLGFCYLKGQGASQDSNKAIDYFTRAANKGDSNAVANLGFCYHAGEGVPQDHTKAIAYYEQAAEAGNGNALRNLGICHANGEGVPQDHTKAIAYYEQAAEAGKSNALLTLGNCYANAEGVPKDHTKSMAYYEQAAKAGNSNALLKLGMCYEAGESVSQDWTTAITYYEQATEAGNSNALFKLGICYAEGNGVTRDWKKSIAYHEQAAEAGHSGALLNLGIFYHEGNGVPKNITKAIAYYEQAADVGESKALFNLGVCYAKADGVPRILTKAITYFEQAAETGHSDSLYNLGVFYEKGEGVSQDWTEAITYYKRAAEAGHSSAMLSLGICYHTGNGVTKDLTKAISNYYQAAEMGIEEAVKPLQICLFLRDSLFPINQHRTLNYSPISLDSKERQFVDFDPPLVAGDWKLLSPTQLTIELGKLSVPLAHLRQTTLSTDYIAKQARQLSLSFYPEHYLIEIQLHHCTTSEVRTISAISGKKSALLLDGRSSCSDLIHGINPYLLSLTIDNLINYLCFFCAYTRGSVGSWHIISSRDHLPFSAEGYNSLLPYIEKTFFAPRLIGNTFEQEGGQRIEAGAVYGDELIVCIFKGYKSGKIEMVSDYTIAKCLSDRQGLKRVYYMARNNLLVYLRCIFMEYEKR